jgi:hypothetical protein
MSDGKKKKKGKKDAAAPAGGPPMVRVSHHPRAAASIRRIRGGAGLAALVVATLLSLRAGLPGFDAVVRGLVAGVVAQFVAWTAALVVWRHLVLAELEGARRRRMAAIEAARAGADDAAAAAA